MKFKGIIKVQQNAWDGKVYYQTSIKGKNQDKQDEFVKWKVILPENAVLRDRTEIEITDGSISFYTNKDGYKLYTIFVREFNVVKEPEEEKETFGDVALEADAPAPDDSELPF